MKIYYFWTHIVGITEILKFFFEFGKIDNDILNFELYFLEYWGAQRILKLSCHINGAGFD